MIEDEKMCLKRLDLLGHFTELKWFSCKQKNVSIDMFLFEVEPTITN